MVLYLDRMYQWGLHAVLWSYFDALKRRLAAEPHGTAELLFPSLCPSGTILLTPCSMVWDWQVSKAGPMLFYWPKLLYPYYSLLFFPFSSFCLYSLVLWGWGLRTDSVYHSLSALHCSPFVIMLDRFFRQFTHCFWSSDPGGGGQLGGRDLFFSCQLHFLPYLFFSYLLSVRLCFI